MPRLLLLVLLALAACADPAETAPEAGPVPATTDALAAEAVEIAPADSAEAAANRALAVGETAPDFALPTASGESVRLSDLTARGPVVLTFYRGAWCPYCNTQLRDYQSRLDEIERRGAALVAISPQVPDSSAVMESENALGFPVLSDVGGTVSDAYGLLFRVDSERREVYRAQGIDLERYNGTDDWVLPVPATYVIDADGVVRSAFVEIDYTQRTTIGQVLSALAAV
ncbi:MAG: peroxiredoxin-like family protein [Bacteroidota bacterium]